MNKKGEDEKLLSIWWFLVVSLVGLALFIGVNIFYSADVDLREIDAQVLSHRLLSCFVNEGVVNHSINSDNIYDVCSLNEFQMDNIYFKIELLDMEEKRVNFIEKGETDFEETCNFAKEEIVAKDYAVCYFSSVDVFRTENGKQVPGKLKILAASNRKGVGSKL